MERVILILILFAFYCSLSFSALSAFSAVKLSLGRGDRQYRIPQTVHGGGNALMRAEDRRTGHEHARARLNHSRRRLGIDAAVHFQLNVSVRLIDHPPHPADLIDHAGNEFLPAETWVDRHHQY